MLRASELTQKEVINISDGKRIGMIVDLEIDLLKGKINAIIIPGEGKFMGLFGKEQDYEISWNQIKKIGDDVILIELKNSIEPYKSQEDGKKAVLEPEFIQRSNKEEAL
ncbi:YlmC/YmxH family sporulation protein [Alkaliphilus pronyensis]|uniref:YlmC/YmxH family sporulation protein n=1 Tax=Alkaliphilus pronyensis TaxID=1482732 RepID=A0A6I0FH65_9FIRM|nr:YlmC/YmxH family sporulation protein [Alkaliphilus pronyensis]KAB3538576.1 YlmC/YmxH family sporulation protein [Alkaliphilus pronyensis]